MKLTKEEIQGISKNPGIYLFTNTVNNKCYVGQAIELRKRLLHHLNNFEHFRYNAPIYNAFSKYGLDSFELTILEEILEIPSENNLTKGGDGGILGYKMTEAQKEVISKNSKKIACDGRYFVYCKNIETSEIISDVNMTELAAKLELNIGGARTAKCKGRLYKGKYIFANSVEELEKLESSVAKEYNSKYDSSINHDDLYLEYYSYLLTLDNPTIQQVADELGLTKDTINKRNKKLRDLGYTLPIQSKNKIDYIELIDTTNNTIEKVQLQDIANKFSITVDSARSQIKRNSLYKKQYKFNIVYV